MDFHDKRKLLEAAIKSRNIEKVRRMLLKNPNFVCIGDTKRDQGEDTPFWIAMVLGYEDIVELFIDLGASVNEFMIIEEDSQLKKHTFLHWMAGDHGLSRKKSG